jgi:hypothetical protein
MPGADPVTFHLSTHAVRATLAYERPDRGRRPPGAVLY